MKRLLLILLLPGLAAVPRALGQDSAVTAQNGTYNPDPGASQKPIQAPFYQMPAGVPPD